MVDIEPFRGLCYAGRWAAPEVFAPPYDVINPAQREQMLARSAHSIVRLDLGPTPAEPAWYGRAADTLKAWLGEGVLQRDDTPAFYGYRQHFGWGGKTYVRTGFMARARLAPWGQGIHRHELTRNQPKADRLELMRALNMQTSPVFGLFADVDRAVSTCLQATLAASSATTSFELRDAEGVGHSVWRIRESSAVDLLRRSLKGSDVVIADGHHRYETALALSAERQGQQDSAADHVLMYLTPLSDPGLLVLATHRIVRAAAIAGSELLATLAQRMCVTATDRPLSSAIQGQQGSFGLRLPGQSFVLSKLSPPAGRPAGATELDVVTLQRTILEPVLGISPGQLADADLISYTTDEAQAVRSVDGGDAALALVLNPTPLTAIWGTALAGQVMPQKSTFFHPKLLTGLVMNPLWS